jgi:hypothetical protein
VGEERFLGGRCEVVDAPAGGVELLDGSRSRPPVTLPDRARLLVRHAPAAGDAGALPPRTADRTYWEL